MSPFRHAPRWERAVKDLLLITYSSGDVRSMIHRGTHSKPDSNTVSVVTR